MTTYMTSFEEFLLTHTPANEYRNVCIAELDRILRYAPSIRYVIDLPPDQFEYQFKLLTCREVLAQFSSPAQRSELVTSYEKRFPKEQLFFILADWLNWDGQVCLYERYGLDKPPAPTTGLVLRYPLPILAAACVATEVNYYWVASQIPEARLQELLGQAQYCAWELFKRRMPKEDFLEQIAPVKAKFLSMAQDLEYGQWE
jgi:hypothetical protein